VVVVRAHKRKSNTRVSAPERAHGSSSAFAPNKVLSQSVPRARLVDMPLIHGSELGSKELEAVVGGPGWDASRFARLCNAIIWTEAGHERSSSLSLTERVFVRDKGIDAELLIEATPAEFERSRFLTPGWNVLQYKLREGGSGRRHAIGGIKTAERSAIRKIYEKTNRRPDSYVLLTNLDLDHDDKLAVREAILEGYDQREEVEVEIYGAGELAAALNNFPHLRSAFFASSDFQIWGQAWATHLEQKSVSHVPLTGRDEEIKNLRTLVDDPSIRAIVASGPSGIGKSRLILEATRHRPLETVSALDPQSLRVRDLFALESAQKETIVLIEEPDSRTVTALLTAAVAHPGLKVLITAQASPTRAPDPRIRDVRLNPLSDEAARVLFRAVAQVDFSLESWVLAQAGGNPELLLRAAASGPQLRAHARDLVAALAEVFEERVRVEVGEQGLRVLRLLSLFTYVGAKSPHQAEIELICAHFAGQEISLNEVLLAIERLVKIGFLRRWGPYVEVIPPFLANHLAAIAIMGRVDAAVSLLRELPAPAQSRMLRRLSITGGPEAREVLEALFAAIFTDLISALGDTEVVYLIAEAMPEKFAAFLTSEIQKLNVEGVQAISANQGRILRRIIERLWLRRSTCRQAIALLVKLSAIFPPGKPPFDGNDFTPLLIESFLSEHPQVPLHCYEKFEILKTLVRTEAETRLRLIGIRAISSALENQSIVLRESFGAEPLDARPRQTYGDVWLYNGQLLSLLVDLTNDKDSAVAAEAVSTIPRALYNGFIYGAADVAVGAFAKIVATVLEGRTSISIAGMRDSIDLALRALAVWQKQQQREDFDRWERVLQDLLKSIESSPAFSIRLRNLLGGWNYAEKSDQHEFEALATEALNSPDVLSCDVLDWLCSEEAQRAHIFFWLLGKIDTKHAWFEKIQERAGSPRGGSAFVSYLGGLAENDSEFVDRTLDLLMQSAEVEGSVILRASLYSVNASAAVKRICSLIEEGRVDRSEAANTLSSPWLGKISASELLDLLQAIAGPEFEFACEAILVMDAAVFANHEISEKAVQFGWKCLQFTRDLKMNDYFHCDHLAATLAEMNPDAAFAAFQALIRRPWSERGWNPVTPNSGQVQFWNVLIKIDRGKAILGLLLAAAESKSGYSFMLGARDFVDPVVDRDLILTFAERGEAEAFVVARIMNATNPGFWDLAFAILDRYPTSEQIRSVLSAGAQRMGEVAVGFSGPGIALADIERKLQEQLSPPARAWLEGLAEGLRAHIKQLEDFRVEQKVNR
jgi:hypothetical protein